MSNQKSMLKEFCGEMFAAGVFVCLVLVVVVFATN